MSLRESGNIGESTVYKRECRENYPPGKSRGTDKIDLIIYATRNKFNFAGKLDIFFSSYACLEIAEMFWL